MKKIYNSPEVDVEMFSLCKSVISTSLEIPDNEFELYSIEELDRMEF